MKKLKIKNKQGLGEEWQQRNVIQQVTNEFRQLFERHLQEDGQLLQRHQQDIRELLERQRQDWKRDIQDFG